MTLKVGQTYQGMWGGRIEKLKIIKISQRKDQKWMVSFRIKVLFNFFYYTTQTLATDFINRIDEAANEAAKNAEIAEHASIVKEVEELEVKYK